MAVSYRFQCICTPKWSSVYLVKSLCYIIYVFKYCIKPKLTSKCFYFTGTVLDVKKGKDGSTTAVYEVLYEGEDLPRTVESLAEDFLSGSIKLIDV